ncbi:MAG TPA: O-antigen ligase family protein [Ferruginibacter sp.]|jgi:O-antigen ligase|nr:O-antigen ligase family protein [Ferruginibacter sp.]
MKKLFFINDTPANKISYYLLMCFLIALPFESFYSEIILIGFVIHTVIHIRKDRLRSLLNKQLLLITSFYLLSVLALIYSNYKGEGVALLTRQLAILLFPILFTLNETDFSKYKLQLLQIFGFACIGVVLFFCLDALRIICYFHLPVTSLFSKEFINQNFSQPLDLHATYFSMYVALSLSTFLFLLIEERSALKILIYSICLVILLFGLIQLSSRSVIIAIFMIVFFAFPLVVLRSKRRIKYLLIVVLLATIFYCIISNIPSFKYRFTNELRDDLTQPSTTNKLTEPRLVRWQAVTELIKRSPIIGYGTGAEIPILKEKYFEKKLYFSYISEFNAHNQYLSFLLNLGILGCGLFLFILCYAFSVGSRNKDILLLSFLIIIVVTAVSEDILNVNKGIFFYGFFIPFFLLFQKEREIVSIQATG